MADTPRGDYVGYGGNPPRVEWPGRARVALNIVLNYEEGSELGSMESDVGCEMFSEARSYAGVSDILYEEGESQPKMTSVGLHCRIIGRPGRARGLDRFLAYVRELPDVWVAQRNDTARFWLERYG